MTSKPDNVPTSLRCGDTWQWTRTLADYPAGTWTLKYRFKSVVGGFEIVCTADGSQHLAAVPAATTADFKPATYSWVAWVESGTDKFTIEGGITELQPDFRASPADLALDNRSHARKMLAAIETWLESKDPAVAKYEIAGRRMEYIPIAELIKLRNRYQNEITAEDNAAKLAHGDGIGRKIQFRM